MIYKVVTMDKDSGRMQAKLFSIGDLITTYTRTGEHHSPRTRAELQGQPILKGMYGPMFDGFEDGHPIIRYEDKEANDALSI